MNGSVHSAGSTSVVSNSCHKIEVSPDLVYEFTYLSEEHLSVLDRQLPANDAFAVYSVIRHPLSCEIEFFCISSGKRSTLVRANNAGVLDKLKVDQLKDMNPHWISLVEDDKEELKYFMDFIFDGNPFACTMSCIPVCDRENQTLFELVSLLLPVTIMYIVKSSIQCASQADCCPRDSVIDSPESDFLALRGMPDYCDMIIMFHRRMYQTFRIIRDDEKHAEDTLKEWYDLDHPGLVRAYSRHIWMYTNDVPLSNLLEGKTGVVPDPNDRLSVWIDIVCALSYLHMNGHAHGKLCAENILVDGHEKRTESRMTARLIRFGGLGDFSRRNRIGHHDDIEGLIKLHSRIFGCPERPRRNVDKLLPIVVRCRDNEHEQPPLFVSCFVCQIIKTLCLKVEWIRLFREPLLNHIGILFKVRDPWDVRVAVRTMKTWESKIDGELSEGVRNVTMALPEIARERPNDAIGFLEALEKAHCAEKYGFNDVMLLEMTKCVVKNVRIPGRTKWSYLKRLVNVKDEMLISKAQWILGMYLKELDDDNFDRGSSDDMTGVSVLIDLCKMDEGDVSLKKLAKAVLSRPRDDIFREFNETESFDELRFTDNAHVKLFNIYMRSRCRMARKDDTHLKSDIESFLRGKSFDEVGLQWYFRKSIAFGRIINLCDREQEEINEIIFYANALDDLRDLDGNRCLGFCCPRTNGLWEGFQLVSTK